MTCQDFRNIQDWKILGKISLTSIIKFSIKFYQQTMSDKIDRIIIKMISKFNIKTNFRINGIRTNGIKTLGIKTNGITKTSQVKYNKFILLEVVLMINKIILD